MAVEVVAPTGEAEVYGETWDAVVVSEPSALDVESETEEIDVTTGVVVGGIPYTGSYEVTPRVTEQVMQTRMKTMADDVTVHAIPCTKTTNVSGGYTAIIGSI